MTKREFIALTALWIQGSEGCPDDLLEARVGWFTLQDLLGEGVIIHWNMRYYISSPESFVKSEKFTELIYIASLADSSIKRIPKVELCRSNPKLVSALTKFVPKRILKP